MAKKMVPGDTRYANVWTAWKYVIKKQHVRGGQDSVHPEKHEGNVTENEEEDYEEEEENEGGNENSFICCFHL